LKNIKKIEKEFQIADDMLNLSEKGLSLRYISIKYDQIEGINQIPKATSFVWLNYGEC